MTQSTDMIKEILGKIPQRIRWCFCAGMISGILIHAYMFTNKLPNWDDINNVGSFGVGSEFGRWFLKYINPLDGIWSVPWIGGLFAVTFLSLAACMVVAALDIRSLTGVVIVPLMMLSFPSVCSMFTFMFTADCYAVGIFLACTAAWLIRKYRFGFVPGIVLLVFSLGLYQAWLCVALGVLVCGLFLDLLREEDGQRQTGSGIPAAKARSVFLRGVKTFVVLLASVALYSFIARRIFPELDSYNGLSQMGQIDPARLPRLILRAYRWVAEYFILKPWSFVNGFSWALNVISCLLAAGGVIAWFVKKRLWKQPAAALLYLFLAAAIPLAMGSIIIMAPDASVSMLMLYQYVILYIFIMAMLERSLQKEDGLFSGRGVGNTAAGGGQAEQDGAALPGKETPAGAAILRKEGRAVFRRLPGILSLFVTVVLLLVGYENFVVTNEAYFRMDIAYERAYAYYNRIMERIESTEGYQPGDAFALVGEYGLSETPDLLGSYPMDGERFEDLSGVARETGLLTSGVRHNFMKIYIGVEMPDVSEETLEAIRQTEEYQNMPAYPAEGCVQKILDVWVVKTCEETLTPQGED